MPSQESPPLAVLVSLSALAVLPINMFVPSLPNIAKDLNASAATTAPVTHRKRP